MNATTLVVGQQWEIAPTAVSATGRVEPVVIDDPLFATTNPSVLRLHIDGGRAIAEAVGPGSATVTFLGLLHIGDERLPISSVRDFTVVAAPTLEASS